MTDLSSKGEPDRSAMASMAGELMQAKMDGARKETSNTHILHVGTFHMEIVPDKDIDIAKIFKDVIDDLYKKYGDRLIATEGEQRHYG